MPVPPLISILTILLRHSVAFGLAGLTIDWVARMLAWTRVTHPGRYYWRYVIALLLFLVFLMPPEPQVAPHINNDLPMIVPPTSILPFYSMLRVGWSKESSFGIAIAGFIILLLAPWTHRMSLRWAHPWLWAAASLTWVVSFILLGWIGMQPPDDPLISVSMLLVASHFLYVLVVPLLWRIFRQGNDAHPGASEPF